jgi:hypothetical protein
MIAKLAYLTSPAPNVYVLHFQEEGREGISRLEISEAHLANIIVDGASFALRKNHRVPNPPAESATNERATSGA